MIKESKTIAIILLYAGVTLAADSADFGINLYPWNVSMSAYHTRGSYSTGNEYFSNAFYFSMDKRMKDRFTLSIEEIIIRDDTGSYRQINYFGRDNFFIQSGFSIGGIMGRFQTDAKNIADTVLTISYPDFGELKRTVYEHPNGWVTGVQVFGDLSRFEYSFSYLHSFYEDVYDYIDEYNFDNTQDTTLSYAYHEEQSFHQVDGTISKRFGSHIIRAGIMTQDFSDAVYLSGAISWEGTINDNLSTAVYYRTGEGRFTVDPFLLILDNNPDILKTILNIRAAWKFSPHWMITSVLSRHQYKSLASAVYHVEYLAFGLQFRF